MIKTCDVNMAMETPNMSGCKQKQLTRSLERILEDAQFSGELKLSGRKLKDFPRSGKNQSLVKYNLQDTVIADLSRNRFLELPEEITDFSFLERLHLYHNAIRTIPETIAMLQSLTYLDISRNQLLSLPREICRLPLQILLVAHNRLPSLPEELGRMSVLAELDAGCNEISSLPSRIGDLSRLRCLDLRCNLLVHIPIELTYLKLVKLDISENRISVLPSELRKMKSLVDFSLSDNPLTSPPAALCIRGRTHIFKYLERQAAKHERARGGRTKRNGQLELRGHPSLDIHSTRKNNSESGYITSDGVDKRWSQESSFAGVNLDQLDKKKFDQSFMESTTHLNSVHGLHQTPMSPSEALRPGVIPEQIISSTRSNSISSMIEGDKKSLNHIQTYREYKEALKQQRATEVSNVYRSKESLTASSHHSNSGVDMIGSGLSIGTLICVTDTDNKKLSKNVMPPLISHEGTNSCIKECYCRSGKCRDKTYKKPSPPLTVSGEVSAESTSPSNMQSCIKNPAIHLEGENNADENRMSPSFHRSVTWNTNATEKFSFTMRREFERAKEEAVLIEQLRNQIETRLKVALPENLAPALMDGVVLCHLANHVKLRSVASIHVPSPAVPKLTMARCRRNVDNFLEACRKIGVDEEVLMDADAIMDIDYMEAYGLKFLSQLVSTLVLSADEHYKKHANDTCIIQDQTLSGMLLVAFISTFILLYFFPIPD